MSKLSSLFSVPEQHKREAISALIEDSSPDAEFFVLLALAAFIVVPGLLLDSTAIIIGGMVVAPILSPILGLAMGITQASFPLIMRSVRTIALASIIAIGAALLIALFSPDRAINTAIESRTAVSLSHLIVAIASGIAAAFAIIKPKISAHVIGIAVSVSLLPPLAVTGIGVSLLDGRLVRGSLSLFLINLLGIVVAAVVVFSLLRFYPARQASTQKLKAEKQS